MIALAGVIALVIIVTQGRLSEGSFLAILFFILIGAVAPVIVMPVGALALFVILFKSGSGPKVVAWLSQLARGTGSAPVPAAGIGPLAYLPPNQNTTGVA